MPTNNPIVGEEAWFEAEIVDGIIDWDNFSDHFSEGKSAKERHEEEMSYTSTTSNWFVVPGKNDKVRQSFMN